MPLGKKRKEKKMKRIIWTLALAIVFAVSVTAVQAADKTTVFYYQVGDKGYFDYPWIEKTYFVIWPDKTMTGASGFGGIITPETKITIVNRRIDRNSLDLLTGKPVVAFGNFKQVGEGEGSKIYCLKLTIFVLSESEYWIPISSAPATAAKK
jgi:hypothetical protein